MIFERFEQPFCEFDLPSKLGHARDLPGCDPDVIVCATELRGDVDDGLLQAGFVIHLGRRESVGNGRNGLGALLLESGYKVLRLGERLIGGCLECACPLGVAGQASTWSVWGWRRAQYGR